MVTDKLLEFASLWHLLITDGKNIYQVNMKLAAAEEALELSLWTTATICRVLSLENVMFFVSLSMFRKQEVIFSITVVSVQLTYHLRIAYTFVV